MGERVAAEDDQHKERAGNEQRKSADTSELKLASAEETTSKLEEHDELKSLTGTEERHTQSGNSPASLVVFKASKTQEEALTVGDSQKRDGTWRRRPERGSSQGLEDPDNLMEEGPKGLIRPAEFTGSTPDRGNQNKKRTQEPKPYHKQLLFSQEIEATWRDRLVEVGLAANPVDIPPDRGVEGSTSQDTCLLVSPTTGILEGATGQDSQKE
ncbi:hypothetical protein R1sor_022374 [Riccia sorocarpa]|uniref:Uncharacterized protein n=1 Tax=Riccia sorocarpa TaxID=122646 RepID=A0ABD3GKD4_9MARC